MSYEQKAEQLKKKLKLNKATILGIKIKKAEILKLVKLLRLRFPFSLKCYKKNNFVCKNNQLLIQDCKRDTTYDEHIIILPG